MRISFGSITDAVIVPVYDMLAFDDEGEEQDPFDGCRVFVRTRRVTQLIRTATGWSPDNPPHDDIGYRPVATFTVARNCDDVQGELMEHLCSVPILRRGRWINTFNNAPRR